MLTANDRKDLACTINALADAIAVAQAAAIDKATIDGGIRLLHQGDQLAYAADHITAFQVLDNERLDTWLKDVNGIVEALHPQEQAHIIALPAPVSSGPWIVTEQAS